MPMFSVVVPTATVELLPYNDRRVSLAITNVGAYRAFLSNDPTNVDSVGFPIDPGQSLSFSVSDGDEPQWQWWAVAYGGSTTLRIYEGYRR